MGKCAGIDGIGCPVESEVHMDIYVWLIILMTACVLLLEFVKLFMDRPIQLEKRNEIDVGKSMTIGSREVQEDQPQTL